MEWDEWDVATVVFICMQHISVLDNITNMLHYLFQMVTYLCVIHRVNVTVGSRIWREKFRVRYDTFFSFSYSRYTNNFSCFIIPNNDIQLWVLWAWSLCSNGLYLNFEILIIVKAHFFSQHNSTGCQCSSIHLGMHIMSNVSTQKSYLADVDILTRDNRLFQLYSFSCFFCSQISYSYFYTFSCFSP